LDARGLREGGKTGLCCIDIAWAIIVMRAKCPLCREVKMSVAYAWLKFYEEAAVQTDFEKLPGCIAKAEQAIQQRLAESPPPLTSSAEFEAIGKALAALAVLKAQMNGLRAVRPLDEERVGGYSA
jgi:hypothetical protein